MKPHVTKSPVSRHDALSRRAFVQRCALGAAALAAGGLVGCRTASRSGVRSGPASASLPLDGNWLFGGKFHPGTEALEFADAAFSQITLPHCVAALSWQRWDPALWEDVWIYRRHFVLPPEFRDRRVFLHFDGVMTGATPTLNGRALPAHVGGYLPFRYEVTDLLAAQENVLAVTVDSRWQNVPPEGSPRGPSSIDYLEPGGLIRSASLRAVPAVFISDIFAKPVDVLGPQRRVEVTCTIDAAVLPSQPLRLEIALMDGARVVTRASRSLRLEKTGAADVALTLADLGNVALWDVDAPRLYEVVATLVLADQPWHDYRTRIGFRDARFERDGFFLNGRQLRIFGLNRHELFPYVGAAMPRRVLRRDAEIIRREFNCNFVRCSHYPQSEAFLEACDELGLMVWEEIPGWQYLGDAAWEYLAVRDVQDMIRRDRNHPAIVIWGVRINESPNQPALYRRTKAAAKALDDSRPTSGTMTRYSTANWLQDVFAFDDYHADPIGHVGLRAPLPEVPYLISETVGQYNYATAKGFGSKYRRAGDPALQQRQALLHAEAHDKGAADPRFAGVVAWCAFDYGSLMNSYDGVKCPGIADVFRVPKLGAAFYLAQGDPHIRPVIEPDFYWDFGPQTPAGPGPQAAIFSNCDRLELWVNGRRHATVLPDRTNYPHLKHPPFFADLNLDGAARPELRIDGYVGDRLALSRSFSADARQDRLAFQADDAELIGDGADATRLVFRVTDKFGAPRLFAGGTVALQLAGPGVIVGDNPFPLADTGGVGAVWIRTVPGGAGRIRVTATHSSLGGKSVEIRVLRSDG